MTRMVVALLLVPAFSALAQTDCQRGSPPRLWEICDVAGLHRGTSADEYRKSAQSARFCGDSGGMVLARAWAEPPTDTAFLSSLVWASIHFRDARVLDAVVDVASDEAQSTIPRLAAFQVMVAYADSTKRVSLDQMNPAVPPAIKGFVLGTIGHSGSSPGGRPMPEGSGARILGALRSISTTATDSVVRLAAARIARQLIPKIRE